MHQELRHFQQQTTRFSVTLTQLAQAQRDYSEGVSDTVWSYVRVFSLLPGNMARLTQASALLIFAALQCVGVR